MFLSCWTNKVILLTYDNAEKSPKNAKAFNTYEILRIKIFVRLRCCFYRLEMATVAKHVA